MRKQFFLIILILMLYNNFLLYAQNLEKIDSTIGVGSLQVSLNCNIPLYLNKKSPFAFDTIHFAIIDSGQNKGKFMMNTRNSLNIKPMYYSAGDSEKEGLDNINMGLVYFAPNLSFRIIKYEKNGYQIVLNEETFETAFIKNDEFHKLYTIGKPYWDMTHNSGPSDVIWFLFETWEVYLKRMMYVTVNEEQDLYDNINGKKKIIKQRSGVVKEVKGNWAKIEIKPYNKNEPAEAAWIKWTDGKKILVRTISAVYY